MVQMISFLYGNFNKSLQKSSVPTCFGCHKLHESRWKFPHILPKKLGTTIVASWLFRLLSCLAAMLGSFQDAIDPIRLRASWSAED
jgi:hypothetical protein